MIIKEGKSFDGAFLAPSKLLSKKLEKIMFEKNGNGNFVEVGEKSKEIEKFHQKNIFML